MDFNLYGWGRSKGFISKISEPKNLKELTKVSKNTKLIARGYGRSYGDSSIQNKLTVITKNLNAVIKFDSKKGIIEAESGCDIKKLLNTVLPKNWILPVIPGSKFISLGGMVASDVHGKNHHNEGSFRNHILEIKVINDKGYLICNKIKNKDLFNYTIGGMGLTGIIYSCKFKLKKINSNNIFQETIKSYNLKDTIKLIKKSSSWDYNVAWVDTSSGGNSIGRSIVFRGNHLKNKDKSINVEFLNKKKIRLLFNFPSWIMNKYVIKLLNSIYFIFQSNSKKEINLENFFFQLDKIHSWNWVYGNSGFTSYQCSFPQKTSYQAIKTILQILNNNKVFSFVSVIKSLGKGSKFLSFGKKGLTVVFDFPNYKNLQKVLAELDDIVIKYNGDIYLVKDSRISQKNFSKTNINFKSKYFKLLRKKYGKRFNSIQSIRLGI